MEFGLHVHDPERIQRLDGNEAPSNTPCPPRPVTGFSARRAPSAFDVPPPRTLERVLHGAAPGLNGRVARVSGVKKIMLDSGNDGDATAVPVPVPAGVLGWGLFFFFFFFSPGGAGGERGKGGNVVTRR